MENKTKRSPYQLNSLHANYEYRLQQLEKEVEDSLRELIKESEYQHPDYSQPAIKVNVFDYTALTILNDTLTFLDSEGLHYSLYAECTLTDLFDIIKYQSEISNPKATQQQ